jgi:hypothetical protein
VSPSYGVRVPTSVATAALDREVPVEVIWLIGEGDALAEGRSLIAALDELAACAASMN